MAMGFLNATSVRQVVLSFDKRMLGELHEVNAYTNVALKEVTGQCKWKVIHNWQTFDFLVSHNPCLGKPVLIKAHKITKEA